MPTGPQFTPLTRASALAFLGPQKFEEINPDGTGELVFARILKHDGNVLSLRIYTGTNKDDSPRAKGEDAVRTQLWACDKDGKPVKIRGSKRVMRVKSWRKNLQRRINDLMAFVMDIPVNTYPYTRTDHQKPKPIGQGDGPGIPEYVPAPGERVCPVCSGPLTPPKNGAKGWFYGCQRYPACTGLVDVCCPDCSGRVKLVKGPRSEFLGCVKFPECRGLVRINNEATPAISAPSSAPPGQ